MPYIKAVSQGLKKKRVEAFPNLENEQIVHEVIISNDTRPYFKMKWVIIIRRWNQGEKEKLVKNILLRAANNLLTYVGSSVSKTISSSELEEEYFGFGKKITIQLESVL